MGIGVGCFSKTYNNNCVSNDVGFRKTLIIRRYWCDLSTCYSQVDHDYNMLVV